ncbi:hypothetical protein KIN20_026319 [Parelaphostrongylus tenuis]|uniref:Uncharacterized protein n=1 Tax=Parelaphostrongylus tenuis TaxID=148309 RepID=A0AAD5QXW7_PARTN|nr:hypothetical protein KIN20_026319 [Parelaphostrongylus tenuis]
MALIVRNGSNTLKCSNTLSDVIFEKHWKAVIHRSICDYFFDAQKKAASPEMCCRYYQLHIIMLLTFTTIKSIF